MFCVSAVVTVALFALAPIYTPTVLAAGSVDQINVIPATAAIALDVRTVPGVDHQELISELTGLAEDMARPHGLQVALAVLDGVV